MAGGQPFEEAEAGLVPGLSLLEQHRHPVPALADALEDGFEIAHVCGAPHEEEHIPASLGVIDQARRSWRLRLGRTGHASRDAIDGSRVPRWVNMPLGWNLIRRGLASAQQVCERKVVDANREE
jgi:hypothetical protein